MHALCFDVFGDPPSVLRLVDLPIPEPGPGEVRLRMQLRPINPSDLLQVEGVYARKPSLPAVAGLEGLGVVDALGPQVYGYSVNQRVIPMGAQGTWQDYLVVPASALVAIPDGLSDESAAQILVNPLTAWLMCVHELKLKEGDWVIQTAAGSAVGRMVIQLGKHRGFRTINLVRHPQVMEELYALGADAVLCTEESGWQDRVSAVMEGKGANAALDAVGGQLGGDLIRLLRPSATMLVYGALSREPLQLGGGQLIFRTTTVRGFWLTDWKRRVPRKTFNVIIAELLNAMLCGQLIPSVEAIYPLNQFREAIMHSQKSGRSGKVLLS